MRESDGTGRPNQRRRTRKDLLQAASRLAKAGRKPSLEEIAEEALVSRATAYRYFASVEALLTEAALDLAMPEPEAIFGPDAPADPAERVIRADAALQAMMAGNEVALRTMLMQSLERGLSAGDTAIPARQNRRSGLIEAALAPARKRFRPATFATLNQALALVLGTEAMIVFKDVLQLSDAEALKVKRWAIRALVDAALEESVKRS
jgi:AcrR family transcriptional regulator